MAQIRRGQEVVGTEEADMARLRPDKSELPASPSFRLRPDRLRRDKPPGQAAVAPLRGGGDIYSRSMGPSTGSGLRFAQQWSMDNGKEATENELIPTGRGSLDMHGYGCPPITQEEEGSCE